MTVLEFYDLVVKLQGARAAVTHPSGYLNCRNLVGPTPHCLSFAEKIPLW